MATLESRHVSVRIDRPAEQVYAYAGAPENVEHWAKGLSSGLERAGDEWVGNGPAGRVRVSFTEHNTLGVLDHRVTGSDGSVVYVPMRVFANGSGSEVLLTLFRQPGTSSERFEQDEAAVRRDLETLKGLLETSAVTAKEPGTLA